MRNSRPFLKVLLILLSFSERWGGLPRDRPRVVLIKAGDKVNEIWEVEIKMMMPEDRSQGSKLSPSPSTNSWRSDSSSLGHEKRQSPSGSLGDCDLRRC